MSREQTLAYRFGFVMEQNLGHRTHYRNLLRFVGNDADVAVRWMPIEFDAPALLMRLPLIGQNWSVRASLLAWDAVRRARHAGRLDAIFYHTQVTALLSPWVRDVPVVVSLDATPINYDSVGVHYGHRSGGPLERAKFALNQRAFAHASALVSWSQWSKDSLARDYGISPEKVHVIAPGVDLAQWPHRWGRERVQASEGRLPRLLFVGGDFERKGGRVLLECFRRYLQDICELSVVTQTPIAPDRNLYVYHNVTPNSDTLLRLYADADIFVFPTLADCAPLAVPEGMAASLPIVTTRVGAIPEMVRDGVQGFVVEPGSVEALAAAIQTLLQSPELRASMGDAGRRVVEVDFDAARNAQRLLNVLKGTADAATHLRPPADELIAARR